MLGNKLHQVFLNTKTYLEQILAGYALPEPYFEPKMRETLEMMMKCLRDPALPLYELQEVISVISGRIPGEVEKSIRKLMATYASNITSVLSQFPSQQIAQAIDSFAATLDKKADRDHFFMQTTVIVQLVQRLVF